MTTRIDPSAPSDWVEFSDPEMLAPRPLVSVLMLAYNHAHLIPAAIDSVLDQRTHHAFELLIGDDCSTDDTLEVVRRYQSAHPHVIRVISGRRNVGTNENQIRLLSFARGALLAFCESDDWWCDDQKLERQIAVFRDRPEVSICFHAARLFDQSLGGFVGTVNVGASPRDWSLDEVIVGGGGLLPTASVMVRATALCPMDEWLLKFDVADYPIAIWAAAKGVCHSLPMAMSVYRTNVAHSWTKTNTGQVDREWKHTLAAIDLLSAFPAKAGRPDATAAVERMIRRYIRDFAAVHGSNAMLRLPDFAALRPSLSKGDRVALFAFNDPASLRMRGAWFAISRWRSLMRGSRRIARLLRGTPPTISR